MYMQLFLFLFIFINVIIYLSLSSYELSEEGNNKLGEFFNGVNMKKKDKFYVVMLLIRRSIFVTFLVTLVSIKSSTLVLILSFMQFIYMIYIIVLRPFTEIKSNLIEIVNEVYFFVLLSSLAYFNTENNWNSFITDIYIWTITSNSMMMFCIIGERTVVPDPNIRIIPFTSSRDSAVRFKSTLKSKVSQNKDLERSRKYTEEETKIAIKMHYLEQIRRNRGKD